MPRVPVCEHSSWQFLAASSNVETELLTAVNGKQHAGTYSNIFVQKKVAYFAKRDWLCHGDLGNFRFPFILPVH